MRSAPSVLTIALVGIVNALSDADLLEVSRQNEIAPLVKRASNLASPYQGYQYVGCWSDASGARTLSNGPNAYNTVETCIDYCRSSASGGPYNYAAIEYHHECYCGNTLRRGSFQEPAADCDAQCDGDSSELCGGGFRLSLYALANAVPTSTATALPTGTFTPPPGQKQAVNPGPYDYVGCYTDQVDGNHRVLTGSLAYAANTMSLETCANLCSTYQPTLTYFAVENGAECYCGSGIQSPNVIVEESNCRTPCTGDNTENCGSANYANVYSNDEGAPYYSVNGGYAGQHAGDNPSSISRASASSVASVSRESASRSRESASSVASVSRESAASSRSVASQSVQSAQSAASVSRESAISAASASSVANSISRASASSAASVSRASESSARSVASESVRSASSASRSSRSSATSSVSSARSSVTSARSSRSSALSSISSRVSSHSSLTSSRFASSSSKASSKNVGSLSQASSRSVASVSQASVQSSRSAASSRASVSRASVASSRSAATSRASASRASVSRSKASVASSLSAAAAATTEVYRYVNCFPFDASSPPLPLHPYFKYLSLQGCANKCYNHTYFGVASGKQCYCGNTLADAGNPISIHNCYSAADAIPCNGNGAEKCGATNAMPIFGQQRFIGDCSQADYFNPSDPCRLVTGSKQGSTLNRLPGSFSTTSSPGGTGTGSGITRPTGGLNSTTTSASLSGGGGGGTRLPGSGSVCVRRTAIINLRLNQTVLVYPTGWDVALTTP